VLGGVHLVCLMHHAHHVARTLGTLQAVSQIWVVDERLVWVSVLVTGLLLGIWANTLRTQKSNLADMVVGLGTLVIWC